MSYGTFIKFHHTIDLYKKVETISPAGQKLHSLSYVETIPCFAQWSSSYALNNPYVANVEQLDIFVPKDFLRFLNYDVRFKNIKDRYGELIEDSYYEVTGIEKKMQFTGKLNHAKVSLKKVVENGN